MGINNIEALIGDDDLDPKENDENSLRRSEQEGNRMWSQDPIPQRIPKTK